MGISDGLLASPHLFPARPTSAQGPVGGGPICLLMSTLLLISALHWEDSNIHYNYIDREKHDCFYYRESYHC